MLIVGPEISVKVRLSVYMIVNNNNQLYLAEMWSNEIMQDKLEEGT